MTGIDFTETDACKENLDAFDKKLNEKEILEGIDLTKTRGYRDFELLGQETGRLAK